MSTKWDEKGWNEEQDRQQTRKAERQWEEEEIEAREASRLEIKAAREDEVWEAANDTGGG